VRAEEFDDASVEELLRKANECFDMARSPLEEKRILEKLHFRPSDDAKMCLLLEAQFYLTAVARKRDEKVARRDFWMEVAVIALIGLEILLSLVLGVIAIREGRQQPMCCSI